MAHRIVSLALLLGVSTQLHLAWRSIPPRRAEPDYSQVIEGLAAVSLGIDEFVAQLCCSPHTRQMWASSFELGPSWNKRLSFCSWTSVSAI